ncbi:MAG: hypothetical protein ACR2QK_05240, partial [Acidimicrobiales bacterium]
DNLNPNFPNDDGVQLWLTFELPPGLPAPGRAVLSSEALVVRGSPFDELGPLQVVPVVFDSFGPPLFDLDPVGPGSDCRRRGQTGLDCEVTGAVADAVANGRSSAQFRLRFETATDGDGDQDLALFFITDSNRNEPGIFTLSIE